MCFSFLFYIALLKVWGVVPVLAGQVLRSFIVP